MLKFAKESSKYEKLLLHVIPTLNYSLQYLIFSYNRVGRDASDAEIEEIIDMGSKAPLADQQEQVQENIYAQIKAFCSSMDDILCTDFRSTNESISTEQKAGPRRSGLSLAVGRSAPTKTSPGELLIVFLFLCAVE